jgi:quercetin dioxygenase-like cupin family protein
MEGRPLTRAVVGATILVAVLRATAVPATFAQGPVVVPVEREPRHRPVFENAVLAVLDVQLPPGYVSLFHTHSNDNVSVRIETGPMRIDTLETTGTEQTALVGRVVFNPATPPYTHRVANLGQTVIRILDIEILATQPTPIALASDDMAGHEVIVDNPRVRISRIVLEPGDYLTDHTHARGWLTAMVRGWPGAGHFSWQEGGSLARPIEAGPTGTERVEIEVK